MDVLFVEPDPDVARRFTASFEDANDRHSIHVVGSGEEALDFVHRRGDYGDAPRPNLVLLDVQLPDGSGHDVLSTLKETPDFRHVPVIVLTDSDAEADVVRSYTLHANAYVQKPANPEGVTELARAVEEFWLSAAELPPTES